MHPSTIANLPCTARSTHLPGARCGAHRRGARFLRGHPSPDRAAGGRATLGEHERVHRARRARSGARRLRACPRRLSREPRDAAPARAPAHARRPARRSARRARAAARRRCGQWRRAVQPVARRGARGPRGSERAALLERVTAADPANAGALAALGDLALAAGDEAKSAALYDRALAAEPANLVALAGKSEIAFRGKRYQESADLLTRAIGVDPGWPFSYVDRARARRSLGDTAGALEDLTAAIELDPEYAWTYVDRGRLHAQTRPGRGGRRGFHRGHPPRSRDVRRVRAPGRAALPGGPAGPRRSRTTPGCSSSGPTTGSPTRRSACCCTARASGVARTNTCAPRTARNPRSRRGSCSPRSPRDAEATRGPPPPCCRRCCPTSSAPRGTGTSRAACSSRPRTSCSITRIERETNRALRARMLFYLAEASTLAGRPAGAARAYLLEAKDAGAADDPETRLARWELAKLGVSP